MSSILQRAGGALQNLIQRKSVQTSSRLQKLSYTFLKEDVVLPVEYFFLDPKKGKALSSSLQQGANAASGQPMQTGATARNKLTPNNPQFRIIKSRFSTSSMPNHNYSTSVDSGPRRCFSSNAPTIALLKRNISTLVNNPLQSNNRGPGEEDCNFKEKCPNIISNPIRSKKVKRETAAKREKIIKKEMKDIHDCLTSHKCLKPADNRKKKDDRRRANDDDDDD